ncbi:Lipocalin-like domain-containing protein [Polaribacter sp. KT25b]|uniref:lipocalin family protein n=1 Tax=Polaribacter sp. KT25b TaxID=1855336 RepID=UPI000879FD4F|nr:lipocalin family protein [Polaribacter sp. KT25b]SDS56027.1 Lipocalin-like domain-containing protein [Polaribacter sp. KT25b]
MKNLIVVALSLILFSCSATKNVRTKEKIIKGNWTLNKIAYSKTGDYKVTMFNDSPKECFEGSSWKFVPNNNSGTYDINNTNCVNGERDFIFVVQEIDAVSGYYDFLLKPKNNENNVGYRLQLTELSETTMQWKQYLNVDGTQFIININFTKQ